MDYVRRFGREWSLRVYRLHWNYLSVKFLILCRLFKGCYWHSTRWASIVLLGRIICKLTFWRNSFLKLELYVRYIEELVQELWGNHGIYGMMEARRSKSRGEGKSEHFIATERDRMMNLGRRPWDSMNRILRAVSAKAGSHGKLCTNLAPEVCYYDTV